MKKSYCVIILLCAVLIVSLPFTALANEVFDRAIEKYGQGKFEEVIEILSGYVEKKPEPAAYWMLGYSLYKLERFDEADEYFKSAYLIDPDFSPKKIEAFAPGLEDVYKDIQQQLEEEFEREVTVPEEAPPEMPTFEVRPGEAAPAEQPTAEEQVAEIQQEPVPMEQPEPVAPEVATPVQPEVTPPAEEPVPPTVTPPVQPRPMPRRLPQQMPGLEQMGGVAGIMAMMAGFMMIAIIIEVAFYIYWSLSLFLIARKLNVAAAWTAWVPLAQLWPMVGAAGKPWWWVLVLLLGPFIVIPFIFISEALAGIASLVIAIVMVVIVIHLWMLISENLGKSKWWGFLMWIPGAFLFLPTLIILGYLAFSKSETGGMSSSGGEDFGSGDSGPSGFDEEF